MKIDTNKLFFYIGTALLFIAVFEVTVLPFIINRYFPTLYIPQASHKMVVAYLYGFAALFYFLVKDGIKRQVVVIASLYLYYVVFQIFYNFV